MKRRKLSILLGTAGLLILGVCGVALALPQPAKAQCGSQASSCKNCHEVQAKDPVNKDGTGWHQSHAFGDFCYICHGGNNQATDKAAAHTGMVAPMADTKAACAQCHPNDLDARAQVYADKLGVPASSAGATPAPTTAQHGADCDGSCGRSASAASIPPAAASESGSIVDYVQRYDENAFGQHPTNWGNVILLVLIGAMVAGGGGLVMTREHLVKVSFKDTKPVTGEYTADVLDMVPDLAKLKPSARKSLQRLLKKPSVTAELLDAVDKLTNDKEQDEPSIASTSTTGAHYELDRAANKKGRMVAVCGRHPAWDCGRVGRAALQQPAREPLAPSRTWPG